MKMHRIGKIKRVLLMAAVLVIMLLALSSCNPAGNEPVVAPKLDITSPPRIERINPDYFNYETNKNEVYKDTEEGVVMPVTSGEKVYIVIDYVNPSNLKINKVQLTGDGQQFEILSKDFQEGSDSNQTKIEFEIGAGEGPATYTISKIYYNLGGQVLSMTLNQDYVDLDVVVDPQFRLKLDFQNYDARTETGGESKTIDIVYDQSLSEIIPSLSNQSTHENTPTKQGGWSFRGYYTLPGGEGSPINNTASYYFWQNVTLYAYYERLYEFTLSNATYPITYKEDGETKTYTKFATITKKTSAGDAQEVLEIFDTIADDNGVYPIVAIGDSAFDKTFTLRTLKIGKHVKTIGKYAFESSKVINVEFHPLGALEKIDERAFMGTLNLGTGTAGFTLPATVKFLGDRCFDSSGWGKTMARGETQVGTKLIIYPEMTHIGNWCFVGTRFTEVIFMPGVKFKVDAVSGTNYTEEIGGESVTADSDYYLGWCLFKSTESIKKFSTLSDGDVANGLEIIPDGMLDIKSYGDEQNVGLTYLNLAEGLKKIGKGAFHYQKLLTSVTLPDTLEDLGGDNALNGPGQVFLNTKEKSEYGAFAECSSLATVNFKDGDGSQLKVIGASAFYNNRVLRSFEIKSKILEFYGDGPFQGCDMLTEVYFGNDNQTIVPQPLNYQRGFPSFRDPEADFFYSMQSFKVFVNDIIVDEIRVSLLIGASDVISRSLPVYSYDMIKNFDNGKRAVLEEIAISGRQGWSMGYYLGEEKDIRLPDGFDGIDILKIGSYAFNADIETVQLPENIMIIAAYAFSGCKNLREVIYGNIDPIMGQSGRDTLQEIGNNAFFNTAITSFTGGINLKLIDKEAFYSCKELVWVDLKLCKDSGFKIDTGVFNRCSKLKYVRLPTSYNRMADATFANCTALKYMVLENSNPLSTMFGDITTQFQSGISSNFIDVYVPSEAAIDNYSGLENLPLVLKN
ncbi:MAG: leucine-rich repeat protein [Clostridia bacterium]|nr:leucine-rich repeat protein [Clostridia bacterium]